MRKADTKKKEHTLIGAENCFAIAQNWYKLNIGYTNPYNVNSPHAELSLIENLMDKSLNGENNLYELFEDRMLIFYGLGVGDTETAIVNWALKKGQKEVHYWGLDVNREFIDNFKIGLKNMSLEYPDSKISGWGIKGLFDTTNMHSIVPSAYICLGGTIGNFYDQQQLFELFKSHIKYSDILILGFQQDTYIDLLFDKYRNNPLFDKFVRSSISKDVELTWIKDDATIRAHVGKDIVFQSRKYDPVKLEKELSKHSFAIRETCSDKYNNICLQFYERVC